MEKKKCLNIKSRISSYFWKPLYILNNVTFFETPSKYTNITKK